MADAKVHIRVLINVRPFRDAMARVVRELNLFAAVPDQPRNYDRATHTWRSDICAAWIHETCRWPSACSCRCHRKD